jgi:hypothetical protein
MRKLPVDISTFSELITSNYVYVDKTEYLYQMITEGRRYFLSRPRRFGKSLLVSTLKEILSGRKELFDGLWISDSDYQWQEHGVIDLDFSKLTVDSFDTFQESLLHMLGRMVKFYAIELKKNPIQPELILEDIVLELLARFGRVALLIDEYDSPILKTLHNEDLAKKIRDKIQQFFTTIKSLDKEIQFVFITGVTSFAKAGLFSGINNVQIITLRDKYAAVCGYTDKEVDNYFSDYMIAWAQAKNVSYNALRQDIKKWYNGYSFGMNVPKVYNPFSLMNALHTQNLENFWFQSGMPTFLVEIMKKEYKDFDPDFLQASRDFLGVFDVGAIPLISLMFQAGYLTIVDYDADIDLYTLDYPNYEVKRSMQKYLLEVFAHIDPELGNNLSKQFKIALGKQDVETAVEILQRLFAHVPYQLHMKEEKYYHSLVMAVCLCAGIKERAEYSTSHGRIDLVIELLKVVYVIEIKFNKPAEVALAQIEERRYYEPFVDDNKQVILLGLSFNREPSNFTVTYAMKQL